MMSEAMLLAAGIIMAKSVLCMTDVFSCMYANDYSMCDSLLQSWRQHEQLLLGDLCAVHMRMMQSLHNSV